VALRQEIAKNEASVAPMFADDTVPMNYYRALREIREQMPRGAILCSEGANTMDIGRTVLPNFEPRQRLDAGTLGTMGVGLGFAIAAAVAHPGKRVVALEGDSAFGFSGMEVETACRYRLPITFIILNNNGIGGGVDEFDPENVPVSVYTPRARYEKLAEAFGGRGFFVTTPAELGPTLKEALAEPRPTIVNVMLNPRADRKPQKYGWLTR
jgi:2-hydroxyacyl-CoA lyase 1